MNFLKKLFGNDNSRSLKNFSETIIIWAGPGPESEGKAFKKDFHRSNPEIVIFLCSTASDLEKKFTGYHNSNGVRAMLFFSVPKHPNGYNGLTHWFQKFEKAMKIEYFKHSPSDATCSINQNNGDGYLRCKWESVKPIDLVDYLSTLETVYSKTQWP